MYFYLESLNVYENDVNIFDKILITKDNFKLIKSFVHEKHEDEFEDSFIKSFLMALFMKNSNNNVYFFNKDYYKYILKNKQNVLMDFLKEYLKG